MKHFVIPDTQCKPGVPLEHLTAAGNYIVDKQPEVIIHLGDHWDMPSLSVYDKGTKKAEGKTYDTDIEAGKAGMAALFAPILAYNAKQRQKKKAPYRPRKVFLIGNHEQRIERHLNANPHLWHPDTYRDLELQKWGWEVHDFLKPVEINGVYYAHYFYNPNTGKPYGGKASTRLNNIGFSFTQGHQQGREEAEKPLANGKTLRALIAGSFYQHDEDYKGYQGNNHWRGCIFKTEVEDGNYCLVELSLKYLLSNWL